MNILIAGVGGQGTLLASRVLGKYALLKGRDCKVSEIHGMSQRGGSVATHVRIGDKVYSPVVSEGEADLILAFETLEAARFKHFLKSGGLLLVNAEKILPMPCITGAAVYPENLQEALEKQVSGVKCISATKIAEEAGSAKAANVVMLGCAAKLCGLDVQTLEEAVASCVAEKFKEINVKAFRMGYAL